MLPGYAPASMLVCCHTHITLYRSKLITFQYWLLTYGNNFFHVMPSLSTVQYRCSSISIKGGAYMHYVDLSGIHASSLRVWAPPLMEVLL